YPSMRLFRQRVRDDWDEVIARVATALRERVAASRTPLSELTTSTPREPAGPPVLADPTDAIRRGDFITAETRYGLLQFRPHDDPAGRSLERYGEYLQAHVALLPQWARAGATVI